MKTWLLLSQGDLSRVLIKCGHFTVVGLAFSEMLRVTREEVSRGEGIQVEERGRERGNNTFYREKHSVEEEGERMIQREKQRKVNKGRNKRTGTVTDRC